MEVNAAFGARVMAIEFASFVIQEYREMRKLGKALIVGLSLAGGALAVPVIASAGVAVDINVAPPAPRVEVVPPPRPGFVWAPGYWEWRGGAHVWIPGRWMGERRGYHWVPDRWEQRGPRWHHWPGHWER